MHKINEDTFGNFPFAFHQATFPLPGTEAIMAGLDVSAVHWRAQLVPTDEPREPLVRGSLQLAP